MISCLYSDHSFVERTKKGKFVSRMFVMDSYKLMQKVDNSTENTHLNVSL